MASRIALLTVLVALIGAACVTGCTVALREQAKDEPVQLPRPVKQQWLGPGSCAAAGCHNANGLKGELGSEYTTWIT
ncbi:MAG TPA: hypothetical protein VE988_00365, partial [Gemmataceae bacterium]|nr:hypothetical protein [Gemmataceae bacterium]